MVHEVIIRLAAGRAVRNPNATTTVYWSSYGLNTQTGCRATAVTTFVLTVILAAVVWQSSQHFRVVASSTR
ncbi:MAG TPA: hypothetical protein VH394_14020 [Thermoanaerobaculia bacterium]|nr:hypothetical protein [Thermoanaerobaculia bacterium]